MAANAGSMFQYWKRFDLQQLQVLRKRIQDLFLTLMKVAPLADQKLILFVQFNIDRTLQLGKPGRRRGDAPK
ncbi:hypothetical protein PAMP_018527 [Pampus punctatissimus]